MRSIVLDTETTGMPVGDGHRVIEIGCVELMGRRLTGRHFHVYLQPDREVDEGAIAVHGITNEFLVGKPRFREVADEFFEFIQGAQLIIHNAAFDIGFLSNEFGLAGQHERADMGSYCTVLDTLMMARERHPGQRHPLRPDDTRNIRFERDRLILSPKPTGENVLFHDRNDRDLERQMQDLAENVMVYRQASELARSRLNLLSAAIRGRT